MIIVVPRDAGSAVVEGVPTVFHPMSSERAIVPFVHRPFCIEDKLVAVVQLHAQQVRKVVRLVVALLEADVVRQCVTRREVHVHRVVSLSASSEVSR